jgi:hypothetical protein
MLQKKIDDGIGNLIRNFVRMLFRHGFRREDVILAGHESS